MHSPADIPAYLMERQLLSSRAVVDGDFRIDDVSRRNAVFVVSAGGRARYVLKVAGDDPALGHEAAVLEHLCASDAASALAAFLPVVVAHDAAEGVLVLESPAEARDLAAQHAHGRYSRELARAMGQALGHLHAVSPGALPGIAHPAWSAPLHCPDHETLFALTPAALELTRIVQRDADLCADLDGLLSRAVEPSLIHGDVRWGNCLAFRDEHSGRWARLQVIDWELCGAGDRSYDLGAFLGEYLLDWRRSIPGPWGPGLAGARHPLRRMRPAMREFWNGYSVAGDAKEETLRRALRFAGLRVITAAFEEAQASDAMRAGVLHLVGLGRHVLRQPDDAATLLGLPDPRSSS